MSSGIGNGELDRPAGMRGPSGEESIELRRYLDALRRSVPLIAAVVVVLTVSIFVVSSLLPKRYKAQTSIVEQGVTVSNQAQNVDALTRELNTINKLVTTDS